MHSSAVGPGQYPADPHGPYAAYRAGLDDPDERPTSWYLSIVVTVLGAGVYLSGYALNFHGGGTGWPVRFAVLAALIAGVGLVPRQHSHPVAVLVLAAAGFSEALSTRIMAPELAPSGLALTVITVLAGLQTAVAVAVLLFSAAADGSGAGAGYDAYAEYYAKALADYYAHYEQPEPEPEQSPVAGGAAVAEQVGRGHGTAQAAAAMTGNPYTDYVGTAAPAQSPMPTQAGVPQAPPSGLLAFGQSSHGVQAGRPGAIGEQRSTPQQ